MATFFCACGKRFQTRPEFAGRSFKCGACGQAVVVPRDDDPAIVTAGVAPAPAEAKGGDVIAVIGLDDAATLAERGPSASPTAESPSPPARESRTSRSPRKSAPPADPVEAERQSMLNEPARLAAAIPKVQEALAGLEKAYDRMDRRAERAETKRLEADSPFNAEFGKFAAQFGKDMLLAGLLGGATGSLDAGIAATAAHRTANPTDAPTPKQPKSKAELERLAKETKSDVARAREKVNEAKRFLSGLRTRKWAMDRIVTERGLAFFVSHRFGHAGAFLAMFAGSVVLGAMALLRKIDPTWDMRLLLPALGTFFVAFVIAVLVDFAARRMVPALDDYRQALPPPYPAFRRGWRGLWFFAGGALLVGAFVANFVVAGPSFEAARERNRNKRNAAKTAPAIVTPAEPKVAEPSK